MFGIEALRLEIQDLRDSVDHLKSMFIDYTENEVKFDEVKCILKELNEDFFDEFDSKFKQLLKPKPVKKTKK